MCSHATGITPAERGPPNRTAHNRKLSRIGNIAHHLAARGRGGEITADQIGDVMLLAVLLGEAVRPGPGLTGFQAQLTHNRPGQLGPAGHVPADQVGVDRRSP
jgi:hypothetical protein